MQEKEISNSRIGFWISDEIAFGNAINDYHLVIDLSSFQGVYDIKDKVSRPFGKTDGGQLYHLEAALFELMEERPQIYSKVEDLFKKLNKATITIKELEEIQSKLDLILNVEAFKSQNVNRNNIKVLKSFLPDTKKSRYDFVLKEDERYIDIAEMKEISINGREVMDLMCAFLEINEIISNKNEFGAIFNKIISNEVNLGNLRISQKFLNKYLSNGLLEEDQQK